MRSLATASGRFGQPEVKRGATPDLVVPQGCPGSSQKKHGSVYRQAARGSTADSCDPDAPESQGRSGGPAILRYTTVESRIDSFARFQTSCAHRGLQHSQDQRPPSGARRGVGSGPFPGREPYVRTAVGVEENHANLQPMCARTFCSSWSTARGCGLRLWSMDGYRRRRT